MQQDANVRHESLADIVDTQPITLSPDSSVDMVLEMFKKLGLRYALIVEHGKLRGIVTKKDLIRHTQQHQSTVVPFAVSESAPGQIALT